MSQNLIFSFPIFNTWRFNYSETRGSPLDLLQGQYIPTIGDLSHTRALERAYSNVWFMNWVGQKTRSSRILSHWFAVNKWIKFT
jgi:hypothetical protein